MCRRIQETRCLDENINSATFSVEKYCKYSYVRNEICNMKHIFK